MLSREQPQAQQQEQVQRRCDRMQHAAQKIPHPADRRVGASRGGKRQKQCERQHPSPEWFINVHAGIK